MVSNRQNKEARRRIARMEAKRALRDEQVRRRKRDNVMAGTAAAVVLALAVGLQLTLFASNPTAAQVELTQRGIGSVPSPTAVPDPSLAAGKTFTGTLVTNQGTLGIELDGTKAPQAVAVFTSLADQGYFSGKTCHRLTVAESMGILQCGSPDGKGGGTPPYTWGPVENSPADGRYPAGSIGVARGSDPNSNSTQFFIAYRDSTIPQDTGGYTIMGKVTSGLDVLTKVAAGGVAAGNNTQDGEPKIPVTIDSLTLK